MVSTRGIKFKFTEGEKVLCYEPDPTKAKVLYDSKVLELVVSRDTKGKKIAEYLVHFSGWNRSWDRCVVEDFILPDNVENRLLQQQLAEDAAINLKGKKKGKLPAILKDSFKRQSMTEDSKDGTDGNTTETQSSTESENSEVEDPSSLDINIVIPDPLKEKLEIDCTNILSKHKLVRLPAETTVVAILEAYVKHYAVNIMCMSPAKNTKASHQMMQQQHVQGLAKETEIDIHFCCEVMDSLRICFDFTLQPLLLYKIEQKQYQIATEIMNKKIALKINNKEETTSKEVNDEKPVKHEKPESSKRRPSSPSSPTTIKTRQSRSSPSQPTSPILSPIKKRGRKKSPKKEVVVEENVLQRRTLRSDKVRPNSSPVKSPSSNRESDTDASSASPDRATSTRSHRHVPPKSPPLPSNATIASPANTPEIQLSEKHQPTLRNATQLLPLNPLSGYSSSASSTHSEVSATKKAEQLPVLKDPSVVLNEILMWRMIPPQESLQTPVPASMIYGAHHLLRLFVKLPDLLNRMNLPAKKAEKLLKHLQKFLQYMSERRDELLSSLVYIDAKEALSEKIIEESK